MRLQRAWNGWMSGSRRNQIDQATSRTAMGGRGAQAYRPARDPWTKDKQRHRWMADKAQGLVGRRCDAVVRNVCGNVRGRCGPDTSEGLVSGNRVADASRVAYAPGIWLRRGVHSEGWWACRICGWEGQGRKPDGAGWEPGRCREHPPVRAQSRGWIPVAIDVSGSGKIQSSHSGKRWQGFGQRSLEQSRHAFRRLVVVHLQ